MIIFISGSINSGKSTAAKVLKDALGKAALIEIDALRNMIDWMPLQESIPINLENAVSLIKNFSKRKIDCVVPYPVSQKDHDFIVLKLRDEKICFFVLDPGIDNALKERGGRKLSVWEKERIKHHYTIGIHMPSFGQIINTADITPEETVKKILGYLGKED